MVDRTAKGQLLERPVIIPGETGCLDGIFLRGTETPAVLVASPHPLLGGSMTNPVVNELAYAAARVGHPSLRFDFRGVGASEGEPSGDFEHATKDMAVALEHLVESTQSRSVAVAAFSFGCAGALRLAAREPRIDRLLLVAPPRKTLEVPSLESVNVPVVVVVGDKDPFVDVALEREVAAKIGPRIRLEVLRDEDHAFRSKLVELCRLTERWLGKVRSS